MKESNYKNTIDSFIENNELLRCNNRNIHVNNFIDNIALKNYKSKTILKNFIDSVKEKSFDAKKNK